MKITHENYYSLEANKTYFTASQVKTYMKCPFQWLATRNGLYQRPETDALFHGKYIDTALTEPDKFPQFCMDNADKVMTSRKVKRTPIQCLDKCIARVKQDDGFMHYLEGETQVILVLDDFYGVPYKAMLDCLNWDENFLTDLKSCRDLTGEEWLKLDDGSFVKVSWIAFWKYPMQLALYREAINKLYGFSPHPYIAAIEKIANIDRTPNYDVFDLMATRADAMPFRGEAKRGIAAMREMAELIDADPFHEETVKRCKTCDWCLLHKKIYHPRAFEYDPRMLEF